MTGRRDPKAGSKIAADEDRFMALWDEGKSLEQIVALTGASRDRVKYVLGYMRDSETDLATAPRRVGLASDALLAALRKHHPEKCGRPG